MWGWWQVVPRIAQRYPWPTNVLLYGALYSSGDALQQMLRGCEPDWQQTRRVATVAIGFHANFNYVWMRLLERALPGRTPRAVLGKVLCDQLLGGPIALSAFYTDWSHVLAVCAAYQLQFCSCLLENSICGTVWLFLGYLPLLLTAKW
ncbi:mpv17-like protein isoform X2 [Monodelphis domestica]|uniref:mpv17-like protein isoform X2 n=1 Tax=Monodelphis domestica TaxID=13616 RepID=UPI00005E99C1|nr:mpv17-like protein isoform X2 [Monodelphis domestica]